MNKIEVPFCRCKNSIYHNSKSSIDVELWDEIYYSIYHKEDDNLWQIILQSLREQINNEN